MFCPNCGAAVREGAQFCGSCGNHLAAASAPAAATPAAPTPGQPTGAVPTTAQPAAPTPSIPLPGAAAVQPTPQPTAQPQAQPAGGPAFTAPTTAIPNPGQPGPSPAPAAPAQPISSSPLVKELFGAPNMQTIGIAAGIGTAAALVLSIFPAIAMNSMSTAAPSLGADSTLNQAVGGMFITGNGMNFFHYLFLSLVMGLSGGIHFDIVDLSSSSMDASNMMSYPLGLTGLALLVGTAFGAFMLARSKSIRFKFTGLVSGFITGLLPAVVITLLAAIAAAPLASGTTIVAKVTGATVRTFFMAYLLSALGALAGYALAQYASDSKNVFGATWQWAHRVRGYTRTVVSVLSFQLALLFIVGLVALFAVAFSSGQGILILTFPVTLLMIGEFFFTWEPSAPLH